MNPSFDVELTSLRDLAPEIREFSFARVDGEPFPIFSGGSHVVLSLPVEGRVHRNPYSLVGDPAMQEVWRIAVRRHQASRGGSTWLHDVAQVGQRLRISAPVNLFPIVRTGRKHLLIAGGIGITPILSQARELARLGADFEVHYAYRDSANAALICELSEYAAGRLFRYDGADRETVEFASLLAHQPLGTHLYICGPAGMVALCMNAAAALGWPASHLHSEQFLAPSGGEPFDVVLARSGKAFRVTNELSLLEAIEQQGVDAPYLCRGGACGQCETAVVSSTSELLHHDLYLNAEERESGRKIMPCVSRARGGCLTLDL